MSYCKLFFSPLLRMLLLHLFERSIQAYDIKRQRKRLNVLLAMIRYILNDTDEDVGDRCIVISA